MDARWLTRLGVAASILFHLTLVGVVIVAAEVRPFEDEPEQRVEVDVVTADEAPPAPVAETKLDVSKPIEPKPSLDLPETKPNLETKPAETPQPQPPQKQVAQKPEPKPKPPVKPAEPEPPKPQAAPQPPPAPAPEPQRQAAPYPPAIAQEPDVTVKYSVLLGLPAEGGDFDAKAETRANISAESAAALLSKLKSCAALPAGVKSTDNVRIVLRVALSPDGQLTREPMLIEASASAKGPALKQGATAALAACQPYTMLPADKYQEWKVLDLTFTPQDFRGG